MKVHELKCWPGPFGSVRDGWKTFEVRPDDRGYEPGDIVILREYVPEEMIGERAGKSEYAFKYDKSGYTGAVEGPFRIGHVWRGRPMPEGCCAFTILRLEVAQ